MSVPVAAVLMNFLQHQNGFYLICFEFGETENDVRATLCECRLYAYRSDYSHR